MNILIVGSGAKEYTMAKEFSKYENVDLIFAAPGNFAISDYAACIDIDADDADSLAEFVKVNNIDLTVASSEKSIESDIAGKFIKPKFQLLNSEFLTEKIWQLIMQENLSFH